MPNITITAKCYSVLSQVRAPKVTDKVLKSGDVRIEITESKHNDLQRIAMGRKLNRKTSSHAIYSIAHHQRIMTDAEYKSTWGNP